MLRGRPARPPRPGGRGRLVRRCRAVVGANGDDPDRRLRRLYHPPRRDRVGEGRECRRRRRSRDRRPEWRGRMADALRPPRHPRVVAAPTATSILPRSCRRARWRLLLRLQQRRRSLQRLLRRPFPAASPAPAPLTSPIAGAAPSPSSRDAAVPAAAPAAAAASVPPSEPAVTASVQPRWHGRTRPRRAGRRRLPNGRARPEGESGTSAGGSSAGTLTRHPDRAGRGRKSWPLPTSRQIRRVPRRQRYDTASVPAESPERRASPPSRDIS